MKFADLIDKILEIQNKYDCDNVDLSVMQEHEVEINGFTQEMQFESQVRDVAVVRGNDGVSRIVFIGKELY